jgi:hypothetical protein
MAAGWRAVGSRLLLSPTLFHANTTEAQEAAMSHRSNPQVHLANPQNAAAHSGSTASPRRAPHTLRALTVGLAAIAALLPAGALAQPVHNAAAPTKAHAEAVHRHHQPSGTRPSITFTNPLGRSRGPGAGAGLL